MTDSVAIQVAQALVERLTTERDELRAALEAAEWRIKELEFAAPVIDARAEAAEARAVVLARNLAAAEDRITELNAQNPDFCKRCDGSGTVYDAEDDDGNTDAPRACPSCCQNRTSDDRT